MPRFRFQVTKYRCQIFDQEMQFLKQYMCHCPLHLSLHRKVLGLSISPHRCRPTSHKFLNKSIVKYNFYLNANTSFTFAKIISSERRMLQKYTLPEWPKILQTIFSAQEIILKSVWPCRRSQSHVCRKRIYLILRLGVGKLIRFLCPSALQLGYLLTLQTLLLQPNSS